MNMKEKITADGETMANASKSFTTDELIEISGAIGDVINKTRRKLEDDSSVYKEAEDAADSAEKAYMKLTCGEEMTREQIRVVQEYITATERLEQIRGDIAYLAGFQDCLSLLRWMGFLK